VKERPIPFSAPMVRATHEDRKTQTRRVMKPQPWDDSVYGPTWRKGNGWPNVDMVPATQHLAAQFCPYGVPGDRLWVREAWVVSGQFDELPPRGLSSSSRAFYLADGETPVWFNRGRYRHARFMPRWASRITLEITGVRVERLQDISEDDIQSEGITNGVYLTEQKRRAEWQQLWESINGAESWVANPWVWVVEFKRMDRSHAV
jgi:hypothetical protein